MKKVYTLTLTNTENFGALLQAFALKKYISSFGVDCSVIHYFNPAMKYSQVTGWKRVRSVIWNLSFARVFKSRKRKNRTNEFRRDFLGLTQKVYKNEFELQELNFDADAFVVGSDQVWNPRNNANDPAFLLAFTNKKKVAYAASFGTNDVPEDYLFQNRKLFENFNAISVREESGAEALSGKLNIQAQIVCDPVFFLGKEEWIEKLRLQDRSHEKYVLCYIMPGNKEVVARIYKLAEQIAGEICASVVVIGEKPYRKNHGVFSYDHDCGPVEFADYIKNAEYVVTNSFHGTAFSVIFRKKFYTVMKNESRGRNTRMENLLKSIGLNDRKIYTTNDEITVLPVDYSESEMLIEEMIKASERFLVNAVK